MAACNVKLVWSDVKRLREIYAAGEATPGQLAKQFKLSKPYVYALLQGAVRQHEKARRPIPTIEPMLTRQRIQDPHGKKFITRVARVRRFKTQIPFATVAAIRYACGQHGMSFTEAAVRFGVTYGTVRRIIRK